VPPAAKAQIFSLPDPLHGTYYRRDGKEQITLTDTTTKTCNQNGCLTRQITRATSGPYWFAFDDDDSEDNGYFRYKPRQGVLEYIIPGSGKQYEYVGAMD